MLSLGSIAHLQYYFARTGLLEGKGGQLAKDDRGKPGVRIHSGSSQGRVTQPEMHSSANTSFDSSSEAAHSDRDQEEPLMLPPTVSTYSHKDPHIEPPPHFESLRIELNLALRDARKALAQVAKECSVVHSEGRDTCDDNAPEQIQLSKLSSSTRASAWYEIQGMHILDMVTLAIRVAKIYYTSHEDPQCLYSIKSERRIREELLGVLDILKRMAGRNFAGGMRTEELNGILAWVDEVDAMLVQEEEYEQQKAKEQESWLWLEGSWEGREREREALFLNSFNPEEPFPVWTPVDVTSPSPTPFLSRLQTGLSLILLHNALLKKSKRSFGEIKMFHTDTAKPYRCAENLRYWVKAAELRWETKLKVDVSAVVHGREGAWVDFDHAVLLWSRAVRTDLTREWSEAATRGLVSDTMATTGQQLDPHHDEYDRSSVRDPFSKPTAVESSELKSSVSPEEVNTQVGNVSKDNMSCTVPCVGVRVPAPETIEFHEDSVVARTLLKSKKEEEFKSNEPKPVVAQSDDHEEYDPFRVDRFRPL